MLALCAAASAAAGMGFEAKAQNPDLTVEVSGLRNYKGHVVLMLWPDSGLFTIAEL